MRVLLKERAEGRGDVNGTTSEALVYEEGGMPLIRMIEKIVDAALPQHEGAIQPMTPTRRGKKLGRTTEGYNPLGISPEAE